MAPKVLKRTSNTQHGDHAGTASQVAPSNVNAAQASNSSQMSTRQGIPGGTPSLTSNNVSGGNQAGGGEGTQPLRVSTRRVTPALVFTPTAPTGRGGGKSRGTVGGGRSRNSNSDKRSTNRLSHFTDPNASESDEEEDEEDDDETVEANVEEDPWDEDTIDEAEARPEVHALRVGQPKRRKVANAAQSERGEAVEERSRTQEGAGNAGDVEVLNDSAFSRLTPAQQSIYVAAINRQLRRLQQTSTTGAGQTLRTEEVQTPAVDTNSNTATAGSSQGQTGTTRQRTDTFVQCQYHPSGFRHTEEQCLHASDQARARRESIASAGNVARVAVTTPANIASASINSTTGTTTNNVSTSSNQPTSGAALTLTEARRNLAGWSHNVNSSETADVSWNDVALPTATSLISRNTRDSSSGQATATRVTPTTTRLTSEALELSRVQAEALRLQKELEQVRKERDEAKAEKERQRRARDIDGEDDPWEMRGSTGGSAGAPAKRTISFRDGGDNDRRGGRQSQQNNNQQHSGNNRGSSTISPGGNNGNRNDQASVDQSRPSSRDASQGRPSSREFSRQQYGREQTSSDGNNASGRNSHGQEQNNRVGSSNNGPSNADLTTGFGTASELATFDINNGGLTSYGSHAMTPIQTSTPASTNDSFNSTTIRQRMADRASEMIPQNVRPVPTALVTQQQYLGQYTQPGYIQHSQHQYMTPQTPQMMQSSMQPQIPQLYGTQQLSQLGQPQFGQQMMQPSVQQQAQQQFLPQMMQQNTPQYTNPMATQFGVPGQWVNQHQPVSGMAGTPQVQQQYQDAGQVNESVEQRHSRARCFMDILRGQWGRDRIELRDDVAELQKAVLRAMSLAGVQERHAILGIQLMMSAEWSEISDRIMLNLNPNLPTALHWYMAAMAKAVYTPDKLRELSQKYETMRLESGESIMELIQRINKVESALATMANKKTSEYDAKRCLIRCIERSTGTRQAYLLQQCDTNEIHTMTYIELCDHLLKVDRLRMGVQDNWGTASAGIRTDTQPWNEGRHDNQERNYVRREFSDNLSRTRSQEQSKASGANATRRRSRSPQQRESVSTQCRYHPFASTHTEDTCRYLRLCKERGIQPTMRELAGAHRSSRSNTDRDSANVHLSDNQQQRGTESQRRVVTLQQGAATQAGAGIAEENQGILERSQLQHWHDIEASGEQSLGSVPKTQRGVAMVSEQKEGAVVQPTTVEGVKPAAGALPYIEVMLEGGVRTRAWIDSLSTGCVINPNLVQLATSVRIEQATGFIHGANKDHPSTIVGVINPLVMLLGKETLVGQRVVVCNDTPVGLILGYDFIKRHVQVTDHESNKYMFKISQEWVSGKEGRLEDNVSLAVNVEQTVEWKLIQGVNLLPGHTAVVNVRPTEPSLVTPAMVFDQADLESQLNTSETGNKWRDLNKKVDVVVQLVWFNLGTGEFSVPIVNISSTPILLESGITVMRSDPVA